MAIPRCSGILLHPTSLPGRFGIGDMGPAAYHFVDFLASTGQSLWQILPLPPTGYGNSPYMCLSAFAGNPLLISLEELVREGFLGAADIQNPPPFPVNRVDYNQALAYKTPLLQKAYQLFPKTDSEDFDSFCRQHSFWLDDYALFMALKELHNGRAWTKWAEDTARRDAKALEHWQDKLNYECRFHKYVQYIFFQQWQALKGYCHQQGVRIIGDMPIYMAHDSADVWQHQNFFYLDEQGNPLVIAGVPPDYFSPTGQRWGNPIYRWDIMAKTGYKWWRNRFHICLEMVDIIRLDHFRGFEAYWQIPASEPDAITGRWVKGPGATLLKAIKADLGSIPVIAEDLGVITPEVDALRDQFNLPGMRVLQMAFGNDPKASEYRPHNHIKNSVVYTTTHDHNTTLGWFTIEPGTQSTQTREEVMRERKYALQYIGSDGREIHWDFIHLAMASVARMAIFPLQDVLGLGAEARMNLPGTVEGNWEWRFTADMLTPAIRKRLYELTKIYERSPS